MDYKKIADEVLEGVPAWDGEGPPHYVMVAAGPSSHKKFLSILYSKSGYKGYVNLSNDTLVKYFPPKEGDLPHNEKNAENIEDFYNLIQTIVDEAAKRKISVIFQDNGDYPLEYANHVKSVKKEGYETFLLTHLIKPEIFNREVDWLIQNDNLPDFKEWGKRYHKRLVNAYPKLPELFDAGMVFEFIPKFLRDDNKACMNIVQKFHHNGNAIEVETIDHEKLGIFEEWKQVKTAREYDASFEAPQRLMEQLYRSGRASAGAGRSGEERARIPKEQADSFVARLTGLATNKGYVLASR